MVPFPTTKCSGPPVFNRPPLPYNGSMFDAGPDLADVLRSLRRADDALTEFVAPWWPGVVSVVAWLDNRPQALPLAALPESAGYWYFAVAESAARPVREAERDEVTRYLRLLPRAEVLVLEENLAYPATLAERLLGITAPHPIHFLGNVAPLTRITARFDGLSLFPEQAMATPNAALGGLSALLAGNSIFTAGDLLDVPDGGAAEGAEAALASIRAVVECADTWRLGALCRAIGVDLTGWRHVPEGFSVSWHAEDGEHQAVIPTADAPVAAGICLPGARTFNPAQLTHALLQQAALLMAHR
jgi:hypothetical protein